MKLVAIIVLMIDGGMIIPFIVNEKYMYTVQKMPIVKIVI